jgi:hypothetical protein
MGGGAVARACPRWGQFGPCAVKSEFVAAELELPAVELSISTTESGTVVVESKLSAIEVLSRELAVARPPPVLLFSDAARAPLPPVGRCSSPATARARGAPRSHADLQATVPERRRWGGASLPRMHASLWSRQGRRGVLCKNEREKGVAVWSA